ncbi:hypothetical protein [Thermoleptolyngbya sp.]
MTHPARDPAILDAVALLNGYGFDMDGFAADYLVSYWAVNHPAHWIRGAIVEALYQGRYRAVSVGQILAVWRRRGQPIPHYTPDFERVVSGRFGGFAVASSASASASHTPGSQSPDRQNQSSPVLSIASSSGSEQGGSEYSGFECYDSESSSSESSSSESSGSESSGSESGGSEYRDPETPAAHSVSTSSDLASNSEPKLESASQAEHQPDFQGALDSSSASAADEAPKDQSGTSDATMNEDSFGGWGRGSVAQNPIHQYVPIIPRIEASAFYAKLRAVACGRDETDEAGAVLVVDSQPVAQPSMLRNGWLLGRTGQAKWGKQN